MMHNVQSPLAPDCNDTVTTELSFTGFSHNAGRIKVNCPGGSIGKNQKQGLCHRGGCTRNQRTPKEAQQTRIGTLLLQGQAESKALHSVRGFVYESSSAPVTSSSSGDGISSLLMNSPPQCLSRISSKCRCLSGSEECDGSCKSAEYQCVLSDLKHMSGHNVTCCFCTEWLRHEGSSFIKCALVDFDPSESDFLPGSHNLPCSGSPLTAALCRKMAREWHFA